MVVDDLKQHLLGREYMGGVERSQNRISENAEVFTPAPVVEQMLDLLPPESFTDPERTFLDPSCGDGQFLAAVLWRKIEAGHDFKQALATVFGVELMQDNVELCRERLLCGKEEFRDVVTRNIVCADSLRYHFRFDNSHPYDDESRQQAEASIFEDE